MSKMECPECGAENPVGTERCQQCGKSLLKLVEDCLDIANPDTSCKEEEQSNRVLWYVIILIIIVILVVTLILSLAPTAYWG